MDQTSTKRYEDRQNGLVRLHAESAQENSRCLFNGFVHWYAFFWTLNGAALAWLYAGGGNAAPMGARIMLTVLFVYLNISAIGACLFVWWQMLQFQYAARKLAECPSHMPPAGFHPRFLKYVFVTGALSFSANVVAWGLLPILLQRPDVI